MEGAIAALREQGMTGRMALVVQRAHGGIAGGAGRGSSPWRSSTPLAALCRELVALMAHRLSHGAAGAPGQIFLPFEIFLPENI